MHTNAHQKSSLLTLEPVNGVTGLWKYVWLVKNWHGQKAFRSKSHRALTMQYAEVLR